MCFKIYAFEEVEKKGKISRDSLMSGRESISSNTMPFESNGNVFNF
jgi:hypothetical protein